MGRRIRLADESDREEWNGVVEGSSASEVYHLYEWGELIEKTYDIRVKRLLAEDDGAAVGVLPFVSFKSALFGGKIVSLPFSDYGGPCTLDDYSNCSKDLLKELVRIGDELNVGFIELRMFPHDEEELFELNFTRGFQAFTFRLDTRPPYEKIWSGYVKKIRKNIRKARREGLRVVEARDREDVEDFYRLYLGRMKDFGTPPAPLSFWLNMWDIFHPRDRMKLIFTVLSGEKIAGFVSLLFKRKLYYVLNVSSKEYWRHRGLNDLLFDWYIKYACENGYGLVDFGRTRGGTGILRFKEKGWGAERLPLNKYYLFFGGEKRNILDVALSSNAYAKLWRTFVPTALTPTLGRWVRRKIGDV
ncbi:MAG: GNAT family N-acetyltransferase [Candidatus Geothermarchaeales archaeon]